MVGKYLKSNWNEIIDSFRRAGPVAIEVPLGIILFIFGLILLNPQYQVIHSQPGYAGLRGISDSGAFWGWLLTIVGVMKLFVQKPVLWRIISTAVMGFVYLSLCINFALNSPAGFVWAFFAFFVIDCIIAEVMLVRRLRGS